MKKTALFVIINSVLLLAGCQTAPWYQSTGAWPRRVSLEVFSSGVNQVALVDLKNKAPDFTPDSWILVDAAAHGDHPLGLEQNGNDIPAQLADLDGDGADDHLLFFRAKNTSRKLWLYYGSQVSGIPHQPASTFVADAGHLRNQSKIKALWENRQVTCTLFDNGLDIFCKKPTHPSLQGIRFLEAYSDENQLPYGFNVARHLPDWVIRDPEGNLVEMISQAQFWGPAQARLNLTGKTLQSAITRQITVNPGEMGYTEEFTVSGWQKFPVQLPFAAPMTARGPGENPKSVMIALPNDEKLFLEIEAGNLSFTNSALQGEIDSQHPARIRTMILPKFFNFEYVLNSFSPPPSTVIILGEPANRPPDKKPQDLVSQEVKVVKTAPAHGSRKALLYLPAGVDAPANWDIHEEAGRRWLVLDTTGPDLIRTLPSLQLWSSNDQNFPPPVKKGDELLISTGITGFRFARGGLKSVAGLGWQDVQPVPVHETPEIDALPQVKMIGRSACLVRLDDGKNWREYRFTCGAYACEVQGSPWQLRLEGDVRPAKMSEIWGATPADISDYSGFLELYWPTDWLIAMNKNQPSGLFVAPTAATPRAVLRKDKDGTVQLAFRPLSAATPDELGSALDWGYKQGTYSRSKDGNTGMWDPALWQDFPIQRITLGLVGDFKEGTQRLLETMPALALTKLPNGIWQGQVDLAGGRGLTAILAQDRDGDGPDFDHDAWYVDAGSDGSIQARYEFEAPAGASKAEKLKVFADGNDYFNDQVCNPAEPEWQRPMIVWFDKSNDGLFFAGSMLTGGALNADEVWTNAAREIDAKTELAEKEGNSHFVTMDLDGDGDWDIKYSGHEKRVSSLVFDIGDVDGAYGAALNPLTGYWHAQTGYGYVSGGAHMHHASRVYKKGDKFVRDGWMDLPQGEINLDDDAAPEVHVMMQNVPEPNMDVIRYTANRLVMDIDNDNGGVHNSAYIYGLPTGPDYVVRTYDGKPILERDDRPHYKYPNGRSFDVDVIPRIFYTPTPYATVPVWMEQENRVYTDPWGHKLEMVAEYIPPTGWNGKRVPTFNPDGSAAGWTAAWTWNQRQKWDVIGAVWRPHDLNPEAMQIWYPHMPGWRFDCDRDANSTWKMYLSPLTGSLHLSGSEWGWKIGPVTDNERWFRDSKKWIDDYYWSITFDFEEWHRDVDEARAPTQAYESYFDSDNDGYFDAALADTNNDGIFERRAYLGPDGTAGIAAGEKIAWFKLPTERPEVPYLLDRYQDLVALSKRSTETYPERLLDWQVAPDGAGVRSPGGRTLPVERVSGWVAALDVYHCPGRPAWSDQWRQGLSRLFTSFARRQGGQRLLNTPYTDDSLKDISVLVVFGIEPDMLPTDAELAALRRWVEAGGKLIALHPPERPEASPGLNLLLAGTGLRITGTDFTWNENRDPYLTGPLLIGPDARKLFTDNLGCLSGVVNRVHVTGRIVEIAQPAQVALAVEGTPVLGLASLGRGRVYAVGGSTLLTNCYTAHANLGVSPWTCWNNYGYNYRQGMSRLHTQPDNPGYLDHLVDHITAAPPAP